VIPKLSSKKNGQIFRNIQFYPKYWVYLSSNNFFFNVLQCNRIILYYRWMKALIVANVLWQLHKSKGSYDPKFVIDECAENDNGVTLNNCVLSFSRRLNPLRIQCWTSSAVDVFSAKAASTRASFPWQGKIGDVFVVYTSKSSLSRKTCQGKFARVDAA